ncbi:MAG: hypothetical protein ABSD41_02230 [Candidatus Bathyarchaeia archaeon]
MSFSNPELCRTILENISEATRGNAEMLERYVKVEEALAKAGLNASSLQDPTLIPKLIGDLISDRT